MKNGQFMYGVCVCVPLDSMGGKPRTTANKPDFNINQRWYETLNENFLKYTDLINIVCVLLGCSQTAHNQIGQDCKRMLHFA